MIRSGVPPRPQYTDTASGLLIALNGQIKKENRGGVHALGHQRWPSKSGSKGEERRGRKARGSSLRPPPVDEPKRVLATFSISNSNFRPFYPLSFFSFFFSLINLRYCERLFFFLKTFMFNSFGSLLANRSLPRYISLLTTISPFAMSQKTWKIEKSWKRNNSSYVHEKL